MVDCSEGSQLENIYCGYVYCTLKGAGPDKSSIRRDGIGDVWTKYENCFCRTEMNVNVPPPCSRLETSDNLYIQLVELAQCG